MYKLLYIVIAACIVLLTGCDNNTVYPTFEPYTVEEPTTPQRILDIDNQIMYFDLIVDVPCYPYFVEDYNAYYCGVDDVIYYGNGLNTILTVPQQYFILAHEDGHSEDPDITNIGEPVKDMEQYADCYAGNKMRELQLAGYLTDADIQSIVDLLYSLPWDDVDHGTPDERYTAMQTGYTGNDCSIY